MRAHPTDARPSYSTAVIDHQLNALDRPSEQSRAAAHGNGRVASETGALEAIDLFGEEAAHHISSHFLRYLAALAAKCLEK